jgi:hypothetical protein
MLTIDHISEASERVRRLRAEADAERLAPRGKPRRLLAGALRQAADKLDPTPVDVVPAAPSQLVRTTA